jgi:hypothetical protein
VIFAWLILNFWQILNLKFGEKLPDRFLGKLFISLKTTNQHTTFITLFYENAHIPIESFIRCDCWRLSFFGGFMKSDGKTCNMKLW